MSLGGVGVISFVSQKTINLLSLSAIHPNFQLAFAAKRALRVDNELASKSFARRGAERTSGSGEMAPKVS